MRKSTATVAVDFDGVIHKYSRGWSDGSIYDPPMAGAIEGLIALADQYAVFVHTTRDIWQVAEYLAGYGIATSTYMDRPSTFWDGRETILVTNYKLPAIAYIDDRAYLFNGWGTVAKDFSVTSAMESAEKIEQRRRWMMAGVPIDGGEEEMANE